MPDIADDLLQVIGALPDNVKLAAGAILAVHWAKIASPPAATACCIAYSADEQRKVENRAQAAAKVAEAKATSAKALDAKTVETKAAQAKAADDVKDQEKGATPSVPDMEGVLVEGDIVRTKATKFKDKFHDKTAKVENVLAKKVRVRMLDGPAAGTAHDFTVDNIIIIDAAGAAVAPGAGTQVPVATGVAPGAAPAATQATTQDTAIAADPAQVAARLFGDADLAE